MSSTTPSSSSAPNAVNGRVQLEVQRCVPEENRPVWGVSFGQRGSYLTANGHSEFGLISYAEDGEGTYQVEPPPGSSRPSTPLPLAPRPVSTATTAGSEQSTPIPATEFHERSLPLLATDISAAGAYHFSPNYALQVMDPRHQYTEHMVTFPYFQNAWQGPSYPPPGGLIPRDFDVHSHQIAHLGSVLGDASPSANPWASLPVTGHASSDGGFTAPSDVDGHQSPLGSVLSSDANSWGNSPFTGHDSPPHVYNSASPGSRSGSSSSAPFHGVQEDFIHATHGEYLEPRAMTSTRPNGGT